MYQIGAFSKMVGMTVKTLRYYHEIGLLIPSKIDETSGYRYYSADEFIRAQRISLLKSLNFTLPEIHEVLLHLEDERDLHAYLQEKKVQLDIQIRELKSVQKSIQVHLEKEVLLMTEQKYTFEIREMPEQEVASVRYSGRYDEMGIYIKQLFKAVGGSVAGTPFAMYYDEEFKEEGADIEVCVPVKKSINKGSVTSRVLEASRCLVTTHVGPYDVLHFGYKAMQDEIAIRGLTSLRPTREVYEKGPGMLLKGNPEKYRTQIIFPIETE